MNIRHLSIISISALLSSNALAEDGATLLKQNRCTACHHVAVKTIGPGFRDIAHRYANDGEAQTRLEQKVRKGGSGNWGKVAMPATNPVVSDADIKAMVATILSTK